MISQLKVQLNLYSHREKDNTIINNLELTDTENPNNKVRELLYSLATGNNSISQNNNNDIQQYINKISELEKMLETIKNENILLKAENNILNNKYNSLNNNEILSTNAKSKIKEIETKETSKKKNTKLLGSIQNIEI